MEKIIIEEMFIEERKYQEIKKQLNKESDYFTIEEIILITNLSKTCPLV